MGLTFRELGLVRKMPRESGGLVTVAESTSAAGMGLCHGWKSVRVPRSRTRSSFRRRRRRADRASGWPGWTKIAAQLVRFWPVIQNMVVGELRVRYQRSILGFVWTLLNPLLMMVILSWVFSSLNKEIENYPLFLFAGMVPWSFLSTCLNECAVCIIQNEGLIRKIYLPKLVFPLARVLIGLVTFVLSLAALFLLLWPLGARLYPSMLLLPVAIVLLAMFSLGLGLIVATANTFYPRLRPSGFGGVAGVVFRDADPVSDHEVSGRHAVAASSQPGVLLYRVVS